MRIEVSMRTDIKIGKGNLKKMNLEIFELIQLDQGKQ